MKSNLFACLIEAFAFFFLVVSLIMQHLVLTSGVIAESISRQFQYNLNIASIYTAFALVAFANIFPRYDKKYYKQFIIANFFVIGLAVAHIIALFSGYIYENWYALATLGFLILLIALFLQPINNYVNSLKS